MFDYDKFFNENPLDVHDQVERHEKIASLCRGKVLDIGCGTGSLSRYYKGEYKGYDISSVAIEKAKTHRRKDAFFGVLDFTTAKNQDFSKVDTIVMAEFLEHIDDDLNIFEAIKKTAKPGTRVIISVPNGKAVPSPDHVREFNFFQLKTKFASFGNLNFVNWIGANQRIICYFEVGIFTTEFLTLGIIAKNEGKGIEHCITSCLGVCDDVIVLVDDTTTDKTEEIARRYTEKVLRYKWNNSFSDARNELLSYVNTPWVLFLDGHEYLQTPPNLARLHASYDEAMMCQITLDNKSIVRYPRLHRANLKYENAVHNKLSCERLGVDNEIMIVHDRVNGQDEESTKAREKQRHQMIVGIMGKQIKEDKTDIRASMHLGLHFHARQEFKKAIKYYKLYLKFSKYAGERWYIRFNLTLCYLALNRKWRAEFCALKLSSESKNRWESNFILGLCYFAQKDYQKAVSQYIESLEVKEQESEYKPIVRDRSATWNQIGECFFNLGQYENAGISFHRASFFCEDKEFKKFLFSRGELMYKIFAQNAK